MVNELPLTQVCPYLLLPNQDFKASYWSGILVKHVYEFGMACGKFRRRSPTPTDPFHFKNKNYFKQLQLCRIQETTFFQRFKCQHHSIHMISSVLPLLALTETDFDNHIRMQALLSGADSGRHLSHTEPIHYSGDFITTKCRVRNVFTS
ncbi:hypothetical protein G6F42_028083 [Rhizopus arrhizus]|nr:hypothetical protein G6F42_028083 [Rhizopus arrhizus]KAG1141885.1 hypothetical protein G6F36_015638 [Rhizopus arrhizus]